ncbi:MADS-box protein ZMM17 [Panicum miliaceum]|uniref:MADS-box protein ZMM17 n=1 Tax=Panicum miliaceum TaxID=4540 RepID=A0A3L6QI29_PANMI|nr:MADS-box protein ZMM17 [Panicum miliaceum]
MNLSLKELIEQYQHATNTHFEEINQDQQIFVEMTRMKNEMDKLETGIRRYTGDDLSSLTLDDISHLEQQLEYSVSKVRARKHQLLNQQLDNLRRKEHILEDQNTFLYRMINENQQAAALQGGEVKLGEMAMLPPPAFASPHSGCYYGGESSSTALQLTPAAPQLHPDVGFRLQPTQPNLQDPACGGLHGHGLQLCRAADRDGDEDEAADGDDGRRGEVEEAPLFSLLRYPEIPFASALAVEPIIRLIVLLRSGNPLLLVVSREEEGRERRRRDKKDSRRSSREDREEEDDRHKKRKKSKHNDREKAKERDSKERHSKEKEKSKRKDKDAFLFCPDPLSRLELSLSLIFPPLLKQIFKEISKDDYFAKNNEFATWLKEEKGKYFSDLSSESARDLFLKFVKQWNKGKLPSQYYEGITSGPRSAHNWNIKA